MAYYNTLAAQGGYLSNVRLKTDPANGVTQDDLDAARAHAKATIDSQLAPVYDVSAWEQETPPIVERIADMLSSAEVLEYKYQRGETADNEDTNLPSVLERNARSLLEMVRRGLLTVVTAGGEVQEPISGGALPESRIPEANFFPASRAERSFGRPTRENLESVYVERGVS